jgi:hypothetical protein
VTVNASEGYTPPTEEIFPIKVVLDCYEELCRRVECKDIRHEDIALLATYFGPTPCPLSTELGRSEFQGVIGHKRSSGSRPLFCFQYSWLDYEAARSKPSAEVQSSKLRLILKPYSNKWAWASSKVKYEGSISLK